MGRAALAAALALLACGGLNAGDFGSEAAGTSAAEFLRVGAGARAAAMGEAYTAAADDAFAVYWNPAAMTRVRGASLGLTHAAHPADVAFDHIVYVQRAWPRVWAGGALTYVDMGRMDESDPTGAVSGSFHPRSYAATFALAADLDPFESSGVGYALGGAAKFVRSEIAQRAQTVAFDLGAISPCPALPGEDGSCALTIQNLGAPLKFDQRAEPLPAVAKLGWAFGVAAGAMLSAEAALSRGEGAYGALGAEWEAEVSAGVRAAARLGVNSMTWGDVPGLSGVSAGVGAKFSGLALDYAATPFGGLGLAHRVSLTFSFGGSAGEKRGHRVRDRYDGFPSRY